MSWEKAFCNLFKSISCNYDFDASIDSLELQHLKWVIKNLELPAGKTKAVAVGVKLNEG